MREDPARGREKKLVARDAEGLGHHGAVLERERPEQLGVFAFDAELDEDRLAVGDRSVLTEARAREAPRAAHRALDHDRLGGLDADGACWRAEEG